MAKSSLKNLPFGSIAATVVGGGGGVLVAGIVETAPFVSSQSTEVKAMGKIGVGIAAVAAGFIMGKGKKEDVVSSLIKGFGYGMGAAGASQLAAKFIGGTSVSGVGQVDYSRFVTDIKGVGKTMTTEQIAIKGPHGLE